MDSESGREVIEFINTLQGYGSSTGCKVVLNLPQIVVVGAQSSGKSSVLNGLIGESILPRGTDTVTKCPIIVQLFRTSDSEEEGVEFQDDPNKERIQDNDRVRKMLIEKMESTTDGTELIHEKEIIIRVYSPNVVDLTVVDLPGIMRVAGEGEEGNDLEERLKDLSMKYIRQKNAIILAVSPANNDICNSDGLHLAREADPEGRRTIGVLTKLDLMDKGTNAKDLLTGEKKGFEIKLGMIGLVNRSQDDVNNNVSVQKQLENEKEFLLKNYPTLASVNGVPYLRKRLHELLVKHINKCLPDILKEMKELLSECDNTLKSIPEILSLESKQGFIHGAIRRFENGIRREIEGCSRRPEYDHKYAGTKIKDIFQNQFPSDMTKAGEELNNSFGDEQIRNALFNSGSYDTGFVQPDAVFRKLAQSQVAALLDPSLECAERIQSTVLDAARRCLKTDKELDQFPELKNAMKNVVMKMLEEKMENLKGAIKDYVRVQASIIMPLDPDLQKKLELLRRQLEDHRHGGKKTEENDEEDNDESSFSLEEEGPNETKTTTGLIMEMAETYFADVKSDCRKYVPRLIADEIIEPFSGQGCLGVKLLAELFQKSEEFIKLSPKMDEARNLAKEQKKKLEKAIADAKAKLEQGDTDPEEEGTSD